MNDRTSSIVNRTSRVVAIVGRPNVGKSALFNRLVGRRVSIVHEESGVTRDRVMRAATWGDEAFQLIDTGGLSRVGDRARRDEIEQAIYAQVEAALSDAAAAILVTDVESGATPLDEEVAGYLRSRGCRTFVAVNKCDHPGREDGCVDFEKLGLPVFPVSALHNVGIGDLMEEVLKALPETASVPTPDAIKVAVVGRPNVGKSSFINRLLRSDRVVVSDLPGTTRDSIDIPFTVGKGGSARRYVLIDTAGIRRKGKIDTSVEQFSRFRAEKSIDESDVAVLVLDAVAGATAQDKKIAAMIVEKNKGCVILVNKWDKMDVTQTKYEPELRRLMPFLAHCPIVFASALSGYNLRGSLDAIDGVAARILTEITTGELNAAVADACRKTQPPAVGGRRLKIFYATQVGKAPLRIRIFVNDPGNVQDAYKSFLVRMLRQRFGLEGVPVVLQFRGRRT